MRHNLPAITVAGRPVGHGHPLFVIAEIGLNHSGVLQRALDMVDAAADAGVSAVKLQTIESKALVSAACPAPAHVEADSLTEFFASFELDEPAHRAVAERARARGVAFISTPFSLDSVALLERVGVDAFKIASGDLTWDALIERTALTGKPLIISTGMATLAEVAHALTVARGAGAREIALLHCVSAYPVPRGSENLRAIETLARAFDVPVGLSDHGEDTFAVSIAVTCGASVYERHFMLEGDADAIDGPVSSTAAQCAELIRLAARTSGSLGSGDKRCDPAEAPNLVPSRRGLYAAADLKPGDRIEWRDLIALRPGDGIPANAARELIGARMLTAVTAGQPLRFEDVDARQERRTA